MFSEILFVTQVYHKAAGNRFELDANIANFVEKLG